MEEQTLISQFSLCFVLKFSPVRSSFHALLVEAFWLHRRLLGLHLTHDPLGGGVIIHHYFREVLYNHCHPAYEGGTSGTVIEDVKGQFVILSLFISDFLGG